MSKLNDLFREVRPGHPVTSEELRALGVSADLAVHYVRAGWLTRLARGVKWGQPRLSVEVPAWASSFNKAASATEPNPPANEPSIARRSSLRGECRHAFPVC